MATLNITAGIAAGPAALSATTRALLLLAGPTNVRAGEVGRRHAVVEWDPPADFGMEILAWQVSLDAGATWTTIPASEPEYRFDGLEPGATYEVVVRGRNANGNGHSSAPFSLQTVPLAIPSAPRDLRAVTTGRYSADLSYAVPDDLGGADLLRYEFQVQDELNIWSDWEETDGPVLSHRVRGLGRGHTYGFRVRAVNPAGAGAQSAAVKARIDPIPPILTRRGVGRLALQNLDRQSLIVRAGGVDCRLSVWWQPLDSGWYATLEVPVNTVVVRSRRLVAGAGLLDRLPDILDGGNFTLFGFAVQEDPGRDAWEVPTHGLFWVPSG